MSSQHVFFQPNQEGPRFQDQTIPVNLLEDSAAFEELVFELAKKIYLDKNPQRQRVPKGFTENVYLKLSAIEEGSSVPVILIAALQSATDPTVPFRNNEYVNYFEMERDTVFGLVENANAGRPFHIDSKYLNYFNRIGKNLEEGETIDFLNAPLSDRNVKFSHDSRRKILLSRNEKLEYPELIQINVLIPAIDKRNKTFQIEHEGNIYEHGLMEDLNETINQAFQEHENKTYVSLKGVGIFNENNKLLLIEDIQSMYVLDAFDISIRLEELLKLQDNWYEGKDGKALNRDRAFLFSNYFNSFYNTNLKLPAIFPTLNGDIVLEWKKGDMEISLEVNLKTFISEIFVFDMMNDNNDALQTVDLNKATDWTILNNIIQKEL